MGLIQIDSVNVLVRSQELPLFARLGPHPRTLIDDATRHGDLFEYWVHEACHVPIELHPLQRWAMSGAASVEVRSRRLGGGEPPLVDNVLERVRDRRPDRGRVDSRSARSDPREPWWDWDDGKIALEHLFHTGDVAASRRPNDFARRLRPRRAGDCPPMSSRCPTPTGARGHARSCSCGRRGITGSATFDGPHRLPPAAQPALPAADRRAGGGGPARSRRRSRAGRSPPIVHPDAVMPRRVDARALLSPFDPVVWNRDRTERLFGFRYRIEIYVPPAEAAVRLLRAAVPARRRAGGPRRPQGRPQEPVDCSCRARSASRASTSVTSPTNSPPSSTSMAGWLGLDDGIARGAARRPGRGAATRRGGRSARAAPHGEHCAVDVGERHGVLLGVERHLRA